MPTRRRAFVVLACLALAVVASMTLALAVGSLAFSPLETLRALFGLDDGIASEVVHKLRLPRALSGFACGGLLALAGALMQVLLRNPLADPYVLGVSGGAGVGALCAMLFGLSTFGITGFSLLGAFVAMFLVFGLAHGDGSWTQTRLLLTGVIVAAGCGALVSLVLSVAPETKLPGMLYWLMGDLSQAINPLPPLLILAATLAIALPFARELNLLARGAETAHALGVPVRRLRFIIYFLAALATAAAVTSAGSIAFVGLIVPHLARLALGNDQRLLLPATVLGGGALLIFADTLARVVIAPQQLPVGVLTALIGVPAFLFLLNRR
jgi:iron complex transport system permease protein